MKDWKMGGRECLQGQYLFRVLKFNKGIAPFSSLKPDFLPSIEISDISKISVAVAVKAFQRNKFNKMCYIFAQVRLYYQIDSFLQSSRKVHSHQLRAGEPRKSVMNLVQKTQRGRTRKSDRTVSRSQRPYVPYMATSPSPRV